MHRQTTFLAAALLFVAPFALADQITVSGHISVPGGGPAQGIEVEAQSIGGEGGSAVTDASGWYSVEIAAGVIAMHLVPPLESRLAEFHGWIGQQDSSFTWNFTLRAGVLISGSAMLPDGTPLSGHPISIVPLNEFQPAGEWFYTRTGVDDGQFQVVVPLGVHWLELPPPPFFFATWQPVDASAGDVGGIVLVANEEIVTPLPERPPDLSKITVGDIDGIGEAQISGAAGAAMGHAHVIVINLDSLHQAHAVTAADGSFSARIFAPPGSALLVKHGAMPLTRWGEVEVGVSYLLSPFPGTIIELPHTHQAAGDRVPFAVVGPVDFFKDFHPETTNWVGAAWLMTGSLGPSRFLSPGATLELEGTLRVFSPEIDATTNLDELTATGQLSLMLLFDGDGQAVGPGRYMSTRLTPTGFPIEDESFARRDLTAGFTMNDFSLAGEHSVEGTLSVTAALPSDLDAGLYRPFFALQFSGFPATDEWLAADVWFGIFDPYRSPLPPILVGGADPVPRLVWHLFWEDPVNGIRGCRALEDRDSFGLSHHIAFQGSPYVIPPVDHRSGRSISYAIDPFVPRISSSDRRIPSRPAIPFALPGGNLNVVIEAPDSPPVELVDMEFEQPSCGSRTTLVTHDLNPGTTQRNDVLSLATGDERMRLTFDRYGRHYVTMSGSVEDIWGNSYRGEGTYEFWVAEPLDIDPGILPSVPLEVGDAINPSTRIVPGVPADVEITVTLYPDSDSSQAEVQTASGRANGFGSFSWSGPPITLDRPGEYRVDLVASYTTDSGQLLMGAMTWANVVMTPPGEAELVAHGRRGVDGMDEIPPSWFVASRDLEIPAGRIPHLYNPYYNGDLLWSRIDDKTWGGDSLNIVASIQDLVGTTAADLQTRAMRMSFEHAPPGTLAERMQVGELPVFSSTTSGLSPFIAPDEVDQIAYSYRSSQRPGVRVRELVTEETFVSDYWRLDTLYDYQHGVGILGDQVNDFKLQYVGIVFRDLPSGRNEYLGQGTGWVFIPGDDLLGTRAMPPFAGPGNGGWTTDGGPILTLEGEDIHIFILPTGTRPGSVLEVGDTFHFAGLMMPTLPSSVAVTVTSPSGVEYEQQGLANEVGYYYEPTDDLTVDEPGAWSVDVRVWHDGQCSGGATIPPYPEGDVLGAEDGRYWFYATEPGQPRLEVNTPRPGFLEIGAVVEPVTIEGRVSRDLDRVVVDYTISMPGFILEHGEVVATGGRYQIIYDPVTLNRDFPNLDLQGIEDKRPGLTDTISIGLLARGESSGTVEYRANTVTLQGQQVYVGGDGQGFNDLRTPRLPGGRRSP
jgi:hypothetical protein